MTTNRTPWTPGENAALVSLYFAMLDCHTTGTSYQKAAAIRFMQGDGDFDGTVPQALADMRGTLNQRSRSSIEFKLMNASAAHHDCAQRMYSRLPHDSMHNHGYRAMPNYQASLGEAMQAALTRRHIVTRPERSA